MFCFGESSLCSLYNWSKINAEGGEIFEVSLLIRYRWVENFAEEMMLHKDKGERDVLRGRLLNSFIPFKSLPVGVYYALQRVVLLTVLQIVVLCRRYGECLKKTTAIGGVVGGKCEENEVWMAVMSWNEYLLFPRWEICPSGKGISQESDEFNYVCARAVETAWK